MARKTIDLHFPSGVGRRLGLREASMRRGEYSAPWGLNCRLEDSLTNRLRGGSFTGLTSDEVDDLHFTSIAFVTENLDDVVTASNLDLVIGANRYAPYLYRDRAVSWSSNVITASRQGRHEDTAIVGDLSDTMRPVAFQLSEAADMGDDVVAVIPHKDAYLICFTETTVWVLAGDPATGALRRISEEVGIIGENAWCVNHDTIYFLSSLGLYSVSANGSDLKPVSEDRIPEDLTGVSDNGCVLAYKHSDRGVYIELTTDPDWFYDTARDQFWPYDSDESDSHVLIGPIKLGGDDSLGLIQTMHGIIAQSSAAVTWRIVPGETAEEAAANGKLAITADVAGNDYSDYVRADGSWSAGRSQAARPRVTAMFACIWLSSAGSWAYEGITMGIEPSGNWRK